MKKLITLACVSTLLITACGQGNNQGSNTNNNETTSNLSGTNGKVLFETSCAQCHGINEDKTGPKLAGVIGRWSNDTSKIVMFVKNSQKVINENPNGYPAQLYHKWNEAAMPMFPDMSDNNIKAIITYVNKGAE